MDKTATPFNKFKAALKQVLSVKKSDIPQLSKKSPKK
jgi:hypothetical protein